MTEFPDHYVTRAGVDWETRLAAVRAFADADPLVQAEFAHQVATAEDAAAVAGVCAALVDGKVKPRRPRPS